MSVQIGRVTQMAGTFEQTAGTQMAGTLNMCLVNAVQIKTNILFLVSKSFSKADSGVKPVLTFMNTLS